MPIYVKDVYKYYGSKKILNKVNLEIKNHEITGLVGPNGAGKTTLMKIIVGLIKEYEGEVLVDEKNLNNFKNDKFEKIIGSTIDDPALILSYSGRKNLKFFHDYFKGSVKNDFKEQCENLIDVLNMGDFIDKKAGNYSMGMKQRLAVAIAAMSNPDYIILDEPTNGMDAESVESLKNYLHNSKKTVLISSHQLNTIESFCDKVFAISEGNIIGDIDLTVFKNMETIIISTDSKDNDSKEVISELCNIVKVIAGVHYILKVDDSIYEQLEELKQRGIVFKLNKKSITDLFYESVFNENK